MFVLRENEEHGPVGCGFYSTGQGCGDTQSSEPEPDCSYGSWRRPRPLPLCSAPRMGKAETLKRGPWEGWLSRLPPPRNRPRLQGTQPTTPQPTLALDCSTSQDLPSTPAARRGTQILTPRALNPDSQPGCFPDRQLITCLSLPLPTALRAVSNTKQNKTETNGPAVQLKRKRKSYEDTGDSSM